MSFLKNTVSFTRFRVQGISSDTKKNFADRLRQFAFMPIDDIAEEKSYGWTSIEDMEDFAFANSPWKGKFLCFSFRLDQRKISPAVLKRQIRKAMDEEQEKLAEIGQKYISRDRKKGITELVKLRLRAKTLPVPAVFEVIWDTEADCLYFEGTSGKLIAVFAVFFLNTLGKEEARTVNLEQLAPASLAENLLRDNGNVSLENLEQTVFMEDKGNIPDENADADSILGEEFLTWLWCKSERYDAFSCQDKKYYFIFENKVCVRGYNGSNKVSTSVSGAANPKFEALLGLEKGKKVNSASLVMSNLDEQFQMNTKSGSFDFLSLKTPPVPHDGENPDTVFFLKMDMVQTAADYFDEAFKQFLLCRLDQEKWQEEVVKIKDWILQGKK